MTKWKYNVYNGKELREFLKKYNKLNVSTFIEGCNLIYKCVLEIIHSKTFKEDEDVQFDFDVFIFEYLQGCAIIDNYDPTDDLVNLQNSEDGLYDLGYNSFDDWFNSILNAFYDLCDYFKIWVEQ